MITQRFKTFGWDTGVNIFTNFQIILFHTVYPNLVNFHLKTIYFPKFRKKNPTFLRYAQPYITSEEKTTTLFPKEEKNDFLGKIYTKYGISRS